MRRIIVITLISLLAAALPLAYFGWQHLLSGVLERSAPEISIGREHFHGVGLSPVTITIQVSDVGTGLDEVIIRVNQKQKSREVFRKKFLGENEQLIRYEFPGINSQLEEGSAELEVRAFDRSFWSNRREERIAFKVDYRKPKIEVLTTQHNATHGGSQLAFYRAFDESLELSGVKVGNRTFEGFKAHGLDPDFNDPNLYVALYAVDLRDKIEGLPVKVVAIDVVGNASSASFYNKVLPQSLGRSSVALSEPFMRESVTALYNANQQTIEKLYKEKNGKQLQLLTTKGTPERLVEQFGLLNRILRSHNEDQVVSLLIDRYRNEKFWNGAFIRPVNGTMRGFGEVITYTLDGEEMGTHQQRGVEIKSPPNSAVRASNSGVVIFSDNLGMYGRSIAIDHGLGLVSFYARLNNVTVSEGDQVKRGDTIGAVGQSGFAPYPHLYFEMRVQGVPVNPVEWWDASWVSAHIDAKILEIKRNLGITIYQPIN